MRTTPLLLVGLVLGLFIPNALAQQVAPAAVDAVFAEWDRSDSPGCAVAVIQHGQVVYTNGYGMADLDHDIPITPQTVFYSGSVSKQFVAFSIALLAEQGKLAIDDDIRTYLPEIPEYERTITIRHLIHHTSGLRDYLQLTTLSGRNYLNSMPEAAVLDLIARQKELNFSPGDHYLYSNSGYFLLAEIVKRAGGMTLRDFAEAQIFAPLGMNDSHFHDDNTMIVKRRADGYSRQNDGGWGLMAMRFALVGSGGLYTTVEDLYRWDQNFYHNTLGSGTQALVDTTLTRGRLTDGTLLGYAFALNVGTYRGLKTIRHSGALGGFRAHLLRFPEQQFSTALLCNLANVNTTRVVNQIADLFLDAHLEPAPSMTESESSVISSPDSVAPVDSTVARAYVGVYFNDELRVTYTLAQDEDHLTLYVEGNAPTEVSILGDDQGRATVGTMAFERDAQGAVTSFVLQSGRVRNLRFVKR